LALATGASGAEDRHSVAVRRYLALGGPDFEGAAASMADELGLPTRLFDLPTRSLSGDQPGASFLTALTVCHHDLILVDELTHDLDLLPTGRANGWYWPRPLMAA
jgi:ATPase subunit of ABC transporter with duplicated ATPase domains